MHQWHLLHFPVCVCVCRPQWYSACWGAVHPGLSGGSAAEESRQEVYLCGNGLLLPLVETAELQYAADSQTAGKWRYMNQCWTATFTLEGFQPITTTPLPALLCLFLQVVWSLWMVAGVWVMKLQLTTALSLTRWPWAWGSLMRHLGLVVVPELPGTLIPLATPVNMPPCLHR